MDHFIALSNAETQILLGPGFGESQPYQAWRCHYYTIHISLYSFSCRLYALCANWLRGHSWHCSPVNMVKVHSCIVSPSRVHFWISSVIFVQLSGHFTTFRCHLCGSVATLNQGYPVIKLRCGKNILLKKFLPRLGELKKKWFSPKSKETYALNCKSLPVLFGLLFVLLNFQQRWIIKYCIWSGSI
jgi:hypothetical protein